ncbi:TIGR02569 family protein [Nocardioides guangzhouensis]|uniref:TIGR02569 family protein n=1 Tax=Nocardioides guangzhouensis TaxID=2497878 RepID=A0A4Q4ZK28_9ACTN|nr:TIGR02569 family protein [Nocardioides guangzhouensis]RYP88683.1 TIGR02569 family protein [Nocardioides guangzhouensis]
MTRATADRPHPPALRLLDASDWEWRRRGPTRRAVRAVGARGEDLRRLPGGSGHVWTDGRLVLKPVGCVPEHTWVCEVYAAWRSTDVRVPEPVAPDAPGAAGWSVDGWGAHVLLPGWDTEPLAEVERVREAGDAFHDAVRDLPRPAFPDDRDDPWAYGDRLAWEDAEPDADPATLAVVERLRAHLAPVPAPDQAVHGDLLPNVLVHDRLPPAVIDWPPYFRPAATALAIAATDAVTFRGAPLSLLDDWATGPHWDQLLVRALLYRLGPTGVFARRNRLMGSLVTHVDRVVSVVDAALDR